MKEPTYQIIGTGEMISLFEARRRIGWMDVDETITLIRRT